MSKLTDFMDIPKSCKVGNTIFKKLFLENVKMNKTDKDIFTKNVDKIRWDYSLKGNNINIKSYKDDFREYDEIEFITVKLKSANKTKRIAEIIMRTIPYPMVLTFLNTNEIRLFTAHQRISLADSNKNTIDEFIFTDWINLDNLDEHDQALFENLNLKNLNFTNFYSFYNDILEKIIRYNVSKIFKVCPNTEASKLKAVYDKIKKINTEIALIKGKMNKETQFNSNVEMNIKIKRLKWEREELMDMLNNID